MLSESPDEKQLERGSRRPPERRSPAPASPAERVPCITYLDGPRLRRALLAGVSHVARQRTELDRINVFPVPDGDTGTNLALTLRSVAEAVRPVSSRSISEVAEVAAEAGVLAARGNSGMLFSSYLLGFARGLGRRMRAGTAEVAEALAAASTALHDVLERPREGTIITVAREVSAEARRRAAQRRDMLPWLRDIQVTARRSLQRTKELLPVLREASVVDAGAKGFVAFFEGVLAYIEGRHIPEETAAPLEGSSMPTLYRAREAGVGAGEGRYCTQVVVRADGLAPSDEIRRALAGRGTSTIVAHTGSAAKVHIHADNPEDVVATLAGFGEIVSRRIEDTMLAGVGRRVAIVTDSSADLPPEWVEKHGVTVVPLQVIVGDRALRDGIDLDAERLREILTTPGLPPPTTSQPTPAEFEARFRSALDRGAEELLGIFVSSKLSGTCGSGTAALRRLPEVPHEAVDSKSASLGVGLMVVRAVELLEEGLTLSEIASELRRIRRHSNVFVTVDTFEFLLRSGRVGRAKAWLGRRLDLKPILTMDADGALVPAGRARGREALFEKLLELLDEALAGARRYRLGVVHFAAPEIAARLEEELRARYSPVEILSGTTTAALAVHAGPGAWAVAYQIED